MVRSMKDPSNVFTAQLELCWLLFSIFLRSSLLALLSKTLQIPGGIQSKLHKSSLVCVDSRYLQFKAEEVQVEVLNQSHRQQCWECRLTTGRLLVQLCSIHSQLTQKGTTSSWKKLLSSRWKACQHSNPKADWILL